MKRNISTNPDFASGGVTFKLGALYFSSTSLLVDLALAELRNRHLQVASKRCDQGIDRDLK